MAAPTLTIVRKKTHWGFHNAPVVKILSKEEKDFVGLLAKTLAKKTQQDAEKDRSTLSPVQ